MLVQDWRYFTSSDSEGVVSVKLLANQQTTAFFPQSAVIDKTPSLVANKSKVFTQSKSTLAPLVKNKAPQVIDSNYLAKRKQDKMILQIPKKGGMIDFPPKKILPPSFQPIPVKPRPGIPDLRPPNLDYEYKMLVNKLRDKQRELDRQRAEYRKLKEECDKLRDRNIFGDSTSIVNKLGKTNEKFVRQFNFIDIDDLGHGSRLDMGIGEKTSKALALGVGLVAVLGVIGRIE